VEEQRSEAVESDDVSLPAGLAGAWETMHDHDEKWWRPPLIAFGCAVLIAPCHLPLLGLAAMATDGCQGDGQPCPPADRISTVYLIGLVAAVISLAVSVLLPHTQSWRGKRNAAAVGTVLAMLWPAAMLLLVV
jgi:hypothetical protein